MNLEENLKALEIIAEKLENENLTLDEGIKLYEEGISLTKACLSDLSKSKQRISSIKEEMAKLTDKVSQRE